MQQPNEQERNAERAVIHPIIADFGTSCLLLVVGIAAGSHTLLGECIRSFLMLAASVYAAFVLRAIHRGRVARFEFGPDKIERFASLVVGLGLVLSGLWVARGTVTAVFEPGPVASSLWLALAAITNAINAAVNVAGWLGMHAIARNETSQLFSAQKHARFTMMVSSLFLQLTLTIAALAKDPALASGMDALGAAFVATLMFVRGAGMLLAALPHILDYHPDPGLAARIRQAASAIFPGRKVVHLRTRPHGSGSQAEIQIAVEESVSAACIAEWNRDLSARLSADGDLVDLSLTVIPERAR